MRNYENKSMQGKVCLITGGTSGVGKETALGLARLNATVVITGMNKQRGEATVSEIKASSQNDLITFIPADLSSQADVRALAQAFISRFAHLHVLINNAGTMRMQRIMTEDGIETTFAVNHLAPFLLTNLLLDMLKTSAPARIINVTSAIHTRAKMNFADLQGEHQYRGQDAYGQSKLANILFTYELAKQLAGTGVTVNCLHPGIIADSNFGRNYPAPLQIIAKLLTFFPKSVITTSAEAGQAVLFLATSQELANTTGKYFIKRREAPSSPATYREDEWKQLWERSVQLTRLEREPEKA